MNNLQRLFLVAVLVYCVVNASCTVNKSDPIGYPRQLTDADVYAGFVSPPAGYGEVSFYWWQGDTLKKERLLDHLELLKDSKITSLQINYAHDDYFDKETGARPHYQTVPAVMSKEWWELVAWFTEEAKKRGMSVSLSDYCLGIGQKSYFDAAMQKYPQVRGYLLKRDVRDVTDFIEWTLPTDLQNLVAYQIDKDGKMIIGTCVDLMPFVNKQTLSWKKPDGTWSVSAVWAEKETWSYDPMNPVSGKGIIESFYDQFEKNIPGEMGKGLNFFFSDELNFKLKGKVWNDSFADEFMRRKGYDIRPELIALWEDIGPRTPKIRMDYNDVYVSLSEENYFKPLYDYNQERKMILGCDHGGRGYQVDEFGDYFRTQRWNQAPGADQPFLSKDIIKAKVAASIGHMYERPRVWLEGFYGSGWGTDTKSLSHAVYANMVMGFNLLSLHGLYYTSYGSWWEWAPPCNHFRMPYWLHMQPFLSTTERLSFLLSQGVHCADVAILYPVEAVVANPEKGKKAVGTAFDVARHLYKNGMDFDFMDYQSLHRAKICKKRLEVGKESFSVIIIPSMCAINHASLEKLVAFKEAGGLVISIGETPVATDLDGINPNVIHFTNKLRASDSTQVNTNTPDEVLEYIERSIGRDFKANVPPSNDHPYVNHRRIGMRDVYAVYNVEALTTCFFRAKGNVELWDPISGKTKRLTHIKQTEEGTFVEMPLTKSEIQLIVFSPDSLQTATQAYAYANQDRLPSVSLGTEWEFELKPVLNNRWGDFYYPASDELMGAWVHKFAYTPTDTSKINSLCTSKWESATYSFGAHFLKMGAVKDPIPLQMLLESVKQNKGWIPYNFSWRWGVEGDCGRQGYHGLKAKVHDDFIRLGKIDTLAYSGTMVRKPEENGNYYYLHSTVTAPYSGRYRVLMGEELPSSFILDGKLTPVDTIIQLSEGNHSVILEYNKSCTTYFLFQRTDVEFALSRNSEMPLSMKWNGDSSILPFDIRAKEKQPMGCYRFMSAPGLQAFEMNLWGKPQVWIDNIQCHVEQTGTTWHGAGSYKVTCNQIIDKSAIVNILVEHERGRYGGAAFADPIKQQCGAGLIQVGDWSKIDGLSSYSGGAIYRKRVTLTAEQLSGNIQLDLGNITSTAEVFINGRSVGVRFAPPWKFDLSGVCLEGDNLFEILIYNTAGNLYTTVPTVYNKSPISGLLAEPVLHFQ